MKGAFQDLDGSADLAGLDRRFGEFELYGAGSCPQRRRTNPETAGTESGAGRRAASASLSNSRSSPADDAARQGEERPPGLSSRRLTVCPGSGN